MAGSQKISPQFICPLEQRAELDMLITPDAGIGSSPLTILSTEISDYFLGENLSEVHHIVRDIELLSNPLGIGYRTNAAAAAESFIR